jgi:FkbM family methyltransferase
MAYTMTIKQSVKRLIEEALGVRVFRSLPRGIDVFQDIRDFLPNIQFTVVCDVGANTGQSVKTYLKQFPGSQIFCFEPVAATFDQLHAKFGGYDEVELVRVALGAAKGTGSMVLVGEPDRFYLQIINDSSDSTTAEKLESVSIDTLDDFCDRRGIDFINYLKVDTEGGDLDVLKGATRLLKRQSVDVVEVEAGMNCRNRRHVPFDAFVRFFEECGYYISSVSTNRLTSGRPTQLISGAAIQFSYRIVSFSATVVSKK